MIKACCKTMQHMIDNGCINDDAVIAARTSPHPTQFEEKRYAINHCPFCGTIVTRT